MEYKVLTAKLFLKINIVFPLGVIANLETNIKHVLEVGNKGVSQYGAASRSPGVAEQPTYAPCPTIM